MITPNDKSLIIQAIRSKGSLDINCGHIKEESLRKEVEFFVSQIQEENKERNKWCIPGVPLKQEQQFIYNKKAKKYGPLYTNYYSDSMGGLYVQTYSPYNISTIQKLKPITSKIEVPSSKDMWFPYEDSGAFSWLPHYLDLNEKSYTTSLEQVKFLAVFFKVSWSIVEEDLKKEYSGKIFTCKNCGNCCKFYEKIPTSRKDRFRWKAEERSDILLKLDHRSAFRSEGPGKEKQCPLLKKRHNGGFVCSIHKTKPECCKNWPFYLSQIKNVGTSWP